MSILSKALQNPDRIISVVREKLIDRYVAIQNRFVPRSELTHSPSADKDFLEILATAAVRSDISDHLPVLFAESIRIQPELIVELGVRKGSSTHVYERVAERYQSVLLSVDIEDCSQSSSYSRWQFVQADDVAFASTFAEWCEAQGIASKIDVLFVDTSHEYEHTVAEIAAWFPHLSETALVFFHDTNMQEVYVRRDGSVGHGWKNERGVIRAIEEYFACTFDETVDFTYLVDGWLIRHHAVCSGLTMLERLPA